MNNSTTTAFKNLMNAANSTHGREIPENPDNIWIRIIEPFLYILMTLCIIISSFTTILVVKRSPLLQSFPGFMMVVIACCDVLFGLVMMGGILPSIIRDFEYPDLMNDVLATLFPIAQNVTTMTLMSSALDRLISIVFPFRYQSLITLRRTATVVLSMGLIGLILPAIYAFTDHGSPYYDYLVYMNFYFSSSSGLFWATFIFMFVIPGVVIAICYTIIICIVVEKRSQIHKQDRRSGSRRSSLAHGIQFLNHIKACKMLFVVTFLYCVGFIPYHALDAYMMVTAVMVNIYLYKICTWVIFIRPCFTIIVFYKMDAYFKKGVKRLFKFSRKSERYNNVTWTQTCRTNSLPDNRRISFGNTSPRDSIT